MSQVNRLSDGRLSAELQHKGDTSVAEAAQEACPDGGGGRRLWDQFLAGAENALRSRKKDDELPNISRLYIRIDGVNLKK